MPAPTYVQDVDTIFNLSTTPKVTAAFDVLAGDILVAWIVVADDNGSDDNAAIAGGSLTWGTAIQRVKVNQFTEVTIFSAVVDSNKNMTVSFSIAGLPSALWGGCCITFRNSNGIGASNKNNQNLAAPNVTLTTTQDNSAIVMANGDWAAIGGGRTYVTTDAGAFTETAAFPGDGLNYGAYGGYYPDAGAAGLKNLGLSAPGATQKFSLAVVEVKGSIPPLTVTVGEPLVREGILT